MKKIDIGLLIVVLCIALAVGALITEKVANQYKLYDDACRRECWGKDLDYNGVCYRPRAEGCKYFCDCGVEEIEACDLIYKTVS